MVDIEELVPETLGGFCGLLAPFLGYGLITISVLINDDFSMTGSTLRELGAADVAYHNIFNFSLIISALLLIVFLLSMLRMAESKVGNIGLVSFMIGCVFLLLTGIFHIGTFPHSVVAPLFFVFSFGGMIIFGLDQFLEFEPVWGVFVWSNLIFALIAASLVSLLSPDGSAIYEVIGSIPLIQFSLVFGTRLFAE